MKKVCHWDADCQLVVTRPMLLALQGWRVNPSFDFQRIGGGGKQSVQTRGRTSVAPPSYESSRVDYTTRHAANPLYSRATC